MTPARRECSASLQSTRVTQQDEDDPVTEESDEMRREGTFCKRPGDKGAAPAVHPDSVFNDHPSLSEVRNWQTATHLPRLKIPQAECFCFVKRGDNDGEKLKTLYG